ncbi:MAG: hypothetical protein ACLRZT_04730 [Clostridium paraputrificum]|nr:MULTISPECIES: hypothetical protein [Clostridium]MDU1869086.1 hypothetical protein [Clostridioides difficile]MBS5926808.1 hypothetical protein [Clostridium sp.]MDB2105039.1 hypothetical protein [Clostridium paraputrificum]MDU1843862.1 hypothetical protein [Clostridium sp.]MDY4722105.1 hypothetical protein [Clostridium paraputrificum]
MLTKDKRAELFKVQNYTENWYALFIAITKNVSISKSLYLLRVDKSRF